MMDEVEIKDKERPFEFRQCISIIKSTGKKAANLMELREIIATVSDDSIFHHTYQYFLKEHILEYTNDFAQWAGESLEERALAEQLSNIDSYSCETISDLRAALVGVIDSYLESFPEPRDALPGDEFFFNETITFVFPVGVWAKNLAEFLIALKFIDRGCIYYHFYEARMRVTAGTDDFSRWLEDSLLKTELAKKIQAIDPFMHTTEEIRTHISGMIMEEVSSDMEMAGVRS
jgi:hypothetical protein